jgi:hypothetical protein
MSKKNRENEDGKDYMGEPWPVPNIQTGAGGLDSWSGGNIDLERIERIDEPVGSDWDEIEQALSVNEENKRMADLDIEKDYDSLIPIEMEVIDKNGTITCPRCGGRAEKYGVGIDRPRTKWMCRECKWTDVEIAEE